MDWLMVNRKLTGAFVILSSYRQALADDHTDSECHNILTKT